MLVIKINVNHDNIDEIHILNTGVQNLYGQWKGSYQYTIVKPEGFEDHVIYHWRDDGWVFLVEQAMMVLIEHEYKTKD